MEEQRLIDANALIEDLDYHLDCTRMSICTSLQECEGRRDEIHRLLDHIKESPTIDPVRHGHWIPTDKTDYGAPVFKCSACGGEDSEIKGDFCRWCGARMGEKGTQQ